MSDVKQVKVDNWGVYFLQRLKHFFNRTDYCDLTLQFQDNAQLKVHRLVLSACTEYFELLERTCEMYEDCLVMPDDLQADVVVPIVNFMYTGQLEFRMELLESLHQTSQIMNMPVLTKLLDAHRYQHVPPKPVHFNTPKRSYSKVMESPKPRPIAPAPSQSNTSKRSFTKAFVNSITIPPYKKHLQPTKKSEGMLNNSGLLRPTSPISLTTAVSSRNASLSEPRPTRYELPEELDSDDIFDNSFMNISYASQPLMVHPDSTKHYPSKRAGILGDSVNSKKFRGTVDIVECKKINRNDNIFEDTASEEPDAYQHLNVKEEPCTVSNQLFDQILDPQDGPKVTIETKDSKQANNIDHAKIISEVLKKYPHLVKSNKNIKLKILNTPGTSQIQQKKQVNSSTPIQYHQEKVKSEAPDYTYETDVLDSKEAARLIALGADNVKGPWICLICGTPGRALHFPSYYKFRRHLVEVHNEKPVSKMCEYCGLKSLKRNYLLHHLYTKHGVKPPSSYHFPKCNLCSYVALTEGYLVKHKLSHTESRNFRCNVCAASYNTSTQLLAHIQNTGHKYSADRKTNLQCIYCLKVFLRESNLYAHLKTNHKHVAHSDGIIDDSDEDIVEQSVPKQPEPRASIVKYEPQNFDNEYDDVETQYQIQQRPDGNIQLISNKKQQVTTSTPTKQKILNSGLNTTIQKSPQKPKSVEKVQNVGYNQYVNEVSISPKKPQNEEIVMIDNNEYIMRNNQLVLNRRKSQSEEYILSDIVSPEANNTLIPTTSMEITNINQTLPNENTQHQNMVVKKSTNINQPIQIVVSNEEEYKALMNSNHSIIFDDGDTNKTLTVLSTPHSTAISTTPIGINNAHPNEMMIIQDNYPINVSDALPADNSNIVVVYSHPVDDQNKQFQIIASQDIGPQFVQSSQVISQNYGSITTSTPVMSAHVLETQVTESWQNNIPESVMHTQQTQIATTAGLQGMTGVDQINMTPAQNETNNINHLPEVSITSNVTYKEPIQEKEMEQEKQMQEDREMEEYYSEQPENINNDVVTESIEEVVEEDAQDVSLVTMNVDVPTETVFAGNSSDIIIPDEAILQTDINTEPLNKNEAQLVDETCIIEQGIEESSDKQLEEPCIIEQGIEEPSDEQIDDSDDACIVEQETVENSEEPFEEREESNIVEREIEDHSEEKNEHIQEPDNDTNKVEQNDSTHIASLNNKEVTLTKVVKQKIQSLASEWSEDEEEAETQEQVIGASEDNSKCDTEINTTTHVPAEIEESIENIQQEMEKQMVDAPEEYVETGDRENLNSSQENDLANLPQQPQINIASEAPKEKITSLLNDWEDNDSQEQNDSTNVNVGEESLSHMSENETIALPAETENVDKLEQKKDDKIKNLVSDWDDDEEEIKS